MAIANRMMILGLMIGLMIGAMPGCDRGESSSQTVDDAAKAAPSSPAQPAVVLSTDGTAATTIVIPAAANDDETLAANELKTFLDRMTGGDFPIVKDDAAVEGTIISVGKTKMAADITAAIPHDKTGPETIRLLTRNGNLYIAGNDDGRLKGTVFAAYELLERLGCRWYFPGETGMDIPSTPNLSVEAIDYTFEPTFAHRNVWPGHSGGRTTEQNKAIGTWQRRVRYGGTYLSVGHNWHYMFGMNDYKQRPEYFSLNNGVRQEPKSEAGWQICTSNPDVIELSAEKALAYFEKNPDATVYSLSPNDGRDFCLCDKCTALDPAQQHRSLYPSIGRRLLIYANAVAEKVAAVRPDRYVAFYAYAVADVAPTDIKVHPNVIVVPAHYCYDSIHPLNDPASSNNVFYKNIIDGWFAAGARNMIHREYYYYACDQLPFYMSRAIEADIEYMKDHGFVGLNAEASANWGAGLHYYTAAKMLWNSDMTLDQAVADYCRMYGPAADAMNDYHQYLNTITLDTPGNIYHGAIFMDQIYTPEHLAQARKLFDAANAIAVEANADAKVMACLAMADATLNYTEKYMAGTAGATAFMGSGDLEQYRQAKANLTDAIAVVKGQAGKGTFDQVYFEASSRASIERTIESLDALASLLENYDVVAGVPMKCDFKNDVQDVGVREKWYDQSPDDTWRTISTLTFWENQGNEGYDGIGWYNTTVRIANLAAGKKVVIRFGAVDESIWVYVNGKPVGQDIFDAAVNLDRWKEPFMIDITGALTPNADNHIVMRVEDKFGMGGIWKPVVILAEK